MSEEIEDIIHALAYSIKVCKTDNGAVVLGDELESRILSLEEKLTND